jgi:hypothetical protein
MSSSRKASHGLFQYPGLLANDRIKFRVAIVIRDGG